MRFLVADKRVIIYGFVIMVNHVHSIWQMNVGIKRENLQRDFLKFTAQKIEKDLQKSHPMVLSRFLVDASDRRYQFWECNALSVEIFSERVLKQKLKYLHENPVRAGLCKFPEQYRYSSASFYKTGSDNWDSLLIIGIDLVSCWCDGSKTRQRDFEHQQRRNASEIQNALTLFFESLNIGANSIQ